MHKEVNNVKCQVTQTTYEMHNQKNNWSDTKTTLKRWRKK